MLALGEEAKKKNLKVGVGLMCRHCDAREELFNRIKDGEIGDIIMLRAYRLTGPVGSAFDRRPSPTASASCCTRSSSSTASSGPAAAASATS